MDGTSRIRMMSKQLFGNADRIEVAAAVAAANSEPLYSRALATDLNWPDNRVQKQLKQFQQAGLLSAVPQLGGERRVYYVRKESHFWEAAARLKAECEAGQLAA